MTRLVGVCLLGQSAAALPTEPPSDVEIRRILVDRIDTQHQGVGIVVGIDRAFFSGQARYSWPPEPCVVQGIDARCGSFVVPENRAKPNGARSGST